MPVDKNNSTELFAQLYEGLTEDAPDVSAMRHSLEEQGVDIGTTLTEGLRLFSDFKKRRRLKLARKKLERLREAVRTWSGAGEQSLGTIREQIARALTGDGGEVIFQTYHRKLGSIDAADLESLRDDAALLEFIAHIEVDEAE